MKKYSSGSFIDAAVRVYGSEADTITSFPATIIGNGGAISPWTISGNMTVSSACGDKTANLWDIASWIIANGSTYTKEGNSYTFDTTLSMHSTPYYFSETDIAVSISGILENVSAESARIDFLHSDGTVSSGDVITDTKNKSENIYAAGLRFNWSTGGTVTLSNIMVNTGSTALSYEPFGYKIPIFLDNISYPIYISEPLRKTLDGSNLYDTIESNGTLTRRADSSGDALATPTTESIEVPTLTTSGTAETINIDTTLKPSAVQYTYTGWHTHSDKKRSGGAWT